MSADNPEPGDLFMESCGDFFMFIETDKWLRYYCRGGEGPSSIAVLGTPVFNTYYRKRELLYIGCMMKSFEGMVEYLKEQQ